MLCSVKLVQPANRDCTGIMRLHPVFAEAGLRRLQLRTGTHRHGVRLLQRLRLSHTVHLVQDQVLESALLVRVEVLRWGEKCSLIDTIR